MKIRLMVLVVGICMAAYCIQSCAGGGETTGTDETAGLEEGQIKDYECLSEDAKELLNYPDLPQDVREQIEASAYCPPPPTTLEKIFAAEEAGTIDTISAHLNRLFAYFAPDMVDPLLRGEEVPYGPSIPTWELQWLNDNFANFSPEGQEKLRKFILPPTDPNSIFHPSEDIADTKVAKDAVDTLGWTPIKDRQGRWKVFYYDKSHATMAKKVYEALEKAWPIYISFFRGSGTKPEKEIYAFIANTGSHTGAFTTTTHDFEGILRPKIIIGPQSDEKLLKTYAVEMLFHHFHLTLLNKLNPHWPYSPDIEEHQAIMAAAYTFAGDHLVYPDFNVEHRYLPEFFSTFSDYRLELNGKHEYGTYMWLFFVNQIYGAENKQAGIDAVSDIIHLTAGVDDPRPLFLYPTTDAYADFAFYNKNHPAFFYKYKDVNGFPTGGPPNAPYGRSIEMHAEKTPRTQTIADELEPGAIKYHEHYIAAESLDAIKQVTIRYTTIENIPDLNRRVAVMNVESGEWKLLGDRNADGMDTFCLTKPEENVFEIVVILSNASMTNKHPIEYEFWTASECELNGTTTMTHTSNTSFANFVSKDKIELLPSEDPNVKIYVLTERTMTYDANWSAEVYDPITLISMDFDYDCTGRLTETYTREEDMRKFEIENGEKGIFYPYPDPYEMNWVTCTETLVTNGEMQVTTTDELPFFSWPERTKELKSQNIQTGLIKGEEKVAVPAFSGETTLEFEYQR